jgi:hypothetical protein
MSEPEQDPLMENIWYVSGTSDKGFSSDPAQALHDLTGAAIIAPGHVKRMFDQQQKRYDRALAVQKKAVERVWEALLDKMEEIYRLEEEHISSSTVDLHRVEANGISIALAILELGHDYQQHPEDALDRLSEMARVRYEQEAE